MGNMSLPFGMQINFESKSEKEEAKKSLKSRNSTNQGMKALSFSKVLHQKKGHSKDIFELSIEVITTRTVTYEIGISLLCFKFMLYIFLENLHFIFKH